MRVRRDEGKRTLEAAPNLVSTWPGQGIPYVRCIIVQEDPSLPGSLGASRECPASPTWPVGTCAGNEDRDFIKIKLEELTVWMMSRTPFAVWNTVAARPIAPVTIPNASAAMSGDEQSSSGWDQRGRRWLG